MEKFSVILPAYNEEFHIFANIQRTIRAMDALGFDYEIITVDDGSSDKTYEEARKAESIFGKVKAMRINSHKGKGAALKYGFQFAKGNLVVFLDADLDLPPEQIGSFLKVMEKNKSDIVIGSKRYSQFNSHYLKRRRVLSFIYQAIVHVLFNLSVTDTQTGLKLFKYEVLKKIISRASVERYAFDLELLINACRLGYKVAEVPVISDSQRDEARGKIKLLDIYRMFVDTLAIFYRFHVRYH